MLKWIMENKKWLFSGVAVSVPLAIIGWLCFQGGDPPPRPNDNSIHQTHSGTGDNVGGDKNVTTDNSVRQTNIGATNVAGRDQTINNYLLGSVDYQQLVKDIKDGEELLAAIPSDKIDLRLKQSAKVKELKQRLEDFTANVFRLHELFTRIPINTERLRRAKEHFDKGEFREADAVLKAEDIRRDVERLKKEKGAAKDKLAAIERDLEERAQEFLLKARLSLFSPPPEGGSRFERAQGWFEQALATARTAEVLHEYADFLDEHNAFRRAEPLYREALKIRRSLAESNPATFLPKVAMTLNNLAALHQATTAYGPALKEYEEALEIRRTLAEVNPEAFLPDVAATLNNLAGLHAKTKKYRTAGEECEEALKIYRGLAEGSPEAFLPKVAITLINLSLFYLRDVPDKTKSIAFVQEARTILTPLCKQAPHLQNHLDLAERVLQANNAVPSP